MFVPGAPLSENLARWFAFTLITSLGWDIPRAALTVVLIVIAGRPMLNALHRASRRARFQALATFDDATPALESTSVSR